jgi:uncharacterized protein YcfJ
MKQLLLLITALGASGLGLAQEMGRVISSTPITQQVAVNRQVCNTEQVAVPQQKSGAGAIMGAIAGGAVGHAIGDGGGNIAATVIGIIGGAAIGDRVENGPGSQMQNVQRCSTQTVYENRPVAYNVVYEYAGRQYAVQMPNDPGPTIALQVTPLGQATQAAPPPATMNQLPVYNVYPNVAPQVYPEPRTYVSPISLELGIGYGYSTGFRGRHHWR